MNLTPEQAEQARKNAVHLLLELASSVGDEVDDQCQACCQCGEGTEYLVLSPLGEEVPVADAETAVMLQLSACRDMTEFYDELEVLEGFVGLDEKLINKMRGLMRSIADGQHMRLELMIGDLDDVYEELGRVHDDE